MNIHDPQNIDLRMAGPLTVSGKTRCDCCGLEFLFTFQGEITERSQEGSRFFHIFTPYHPFACPACDQEYNSIPLAAHNPTLVLASVLRPILLTAVN